MPKKSKLSTPDWIKEGFDSKKDWEKARGIKGKEKGKKISIKVCPKCGSKEIEVVLGGKEGKGSKGWKCKKCGWEGKETDKLELNEEEFMKYLDEKGEEVA